MRLFCLLAIFWASLCNSQAQDSTIVYQIGLNISGSTEQTPFLLHRNRYGSVPLEGNYASGSWRIQKTYNPNNPRIAQWSAGAELITNYSLDQKSNVFFTDLYLAGKLGPIEMSIGQKKEIYGIVDTLMSAGSLTMSGNARPYPKIQFSIPHFLPLHFTDDFIALKASYSDGLLGNSELNYGDIKQIPYTYLHQKSVYFRLGKPYQKLHYYLGMTHLAIWGGEGSIWPLYENISKGTSYLKTISGKALNRIRTGSHFGTVDLGLQLKHHGWKYMIYRQSIFDTGSLFKIINYSDGLNGFSAQRLLPQSEIPQYFMIQSYLVEVISTKSQINQHPDYELGIYKNGNYGNSLFYKNGWSYKGRMMGNPLISPQSATAEHLPAYATQFTNNNRILGINTGIVASMATTKFIFQGNYTMNYGTYLSPFDSMKYQLSLMLGIETSITKRKNTSLTMQIATDQGELYPNSAGINIGIKSGGFLGWGR